MNRNIYKVIYSKSRGQMVVVGELASGKSRSSTGGGEPIHIGNCPVFMYYGKRRIVSVLTALAIGTMALSPSLAKAEIIADSNAPINQQAMVTTTASGIPQVNIQTPSSSGVSRNTFSRFDIDPQGAILNNSRVTVQTQLGGLVLGNPSLATGAAQVILNEVNSTDPSQLRGYIEVAGDRAQVVVANPAGITCDGCGFINANRTTLTTGTPIVSSGNLDGYIVKRGTISIEGDGLDTSRSDFTYIISRAVKINAGIFANDLHITTGSNQVNAGNNSATPITGTGDTPTFAIDVSELGGMYAGKIRLIGTESGVGVRNAGVLGASAGEVHITTAGILENIGQISATTDVQLNGDEDIINSGELLTNVDVVINANNTLDNSDGLIDAKNVDITAGIVVNKGEGRIYGDKVTIAAVTLNNSKDKGAAAIIAARQQLNLGVQILNNRDGATLYSDGDIVIGGDLDSDRNVINAAETINNNSGIIDAGGDINISTNTINNTNETFQTQLVQTATESVEEYALVGSPNRYRPDEVSLMPDNNDDVNFLVTPTGVDDSYNKFNFNRTIQETEVLESNPGKIIAGGDIRVTADTLSNENSQILAGGVLTANLDTLINTETPGSRISTDSGSVTTFSRRNEKGRDSTRVTVNAYNPAPAIQSISLGASGFSGNTVTTGSGTEIPLLNSRLFTVAPDHSANFLIETDPRFINERIFLSSDFVLDQLSFDPILTQKRLGDGFYEQRLVREQVAQLTGRRFLDGFVNDENQFQTLLNAGVTAVTELNLRPGIALSATQIAQLTSDVVVLVEKDVTLPNGDISKALVAQLYVRLQDGDLNGNGGLLSASEISLAVSGDINNSGRIAGRDVVSLTAENINNTGGDIGSLITELRGRVDVTVNGGDIRGDKTLVIDAGRDINLSSTTSTQNNTQSTRTNINRVASLFVSNNGGTLVATAGRNLSLNAAQVVNAGVEGSTTLSADNNIELNTVTESFRHDVVTDANNFRKESGSSEVGSIIQTIGDLQINAENNVSLKAATLTSEEGDITVVAGNDISVDAGKITKSLDEGLKRTSKGFLSSTTKIRRDQVDETLSQQSTLSAEQVSLQAGKDISITGSNIVGNKEVTLSAEDNINIINATEMLRQRTLKKEKKSGVFSSGGFGITIGSQQQSVDSNNTKTTAAGSTVGSIEGNIDINAGGNYAQEGSAVVAPDGDINVSAQNINIVAAKNTSVTVQETKFKQSGLSISITNPVLSALQTVKQVNTASKRTKNGRLKKLATATKALAVLNAYEAVEARKAKVARDAIDNGNEAAKDTNTGDPIKDKAAETGTTADKIGGINVSISLGSSKSQSTTVQTSASAVSSTLEAGKDITLTANAEKGDIDIKGSLVRAGNNVILQAEEDIKLVAASNTASQDRKNSSGSASVGVSFGSNGLSVNASVSKGRGKAEGDDISFTNTRIEAGNGADLASGGDTTLRGAVVSAKQVVADVGGDLNIESLQDKSTYRSKQNTSGFSISVPIGPGLISGSVNASKTTVDADFASVTEQTGLRAGDGGFQVNVGVNTGLVGGIIVSTELAEQQGKNKLTTATLITKNIENREKVEGSQSGISIGSGTLTKYKIAKDVIGNLSSNTALESSQASTTRTSVSTTNVQITDEDKQQLLTGNTASKTIASLNTSISSGKDSSNALIKTDVQDINTELQASTTIKETFAKQVITITDDAYKTLFQRIPKFYKVTCPAGVNCTVNPDRAIATLVTAEEVAKNGSNETVVAVNGIFNNLERAGELAYQNTDLVYAGYDEEGSEIREKPDTIYLLHYVPANGRIAEFLAAGYETLLTQSDYDTADALGYSNVDIAYAEVLRSRGNQETESLGHSRGTQVQTNAFRILGNQIDAQGNTFDNDKLTVRSVGVATNIAELAKEARNLDVVGENIRASIFNNDAVSAFLTGTERTLSIGELLSSLVKTVRKSNSAHSCYGTGAKGCSEVEISVINGPELELGTNNSRLIKFENGELLQRNENK